jgi:uncharacterized delta-60 repeat protein
MYGAGALGRGACLLVLAAVFLALPTMGFAKSGSGQLDDSFGGDGVARTQVDGNPGGAEAVAIGRKGKVIAAGSVFVGKARPVDQFGVARYKPNGRLDRSFSGDGTASLGFGMSDAFTHAVAIGPKGSILVAGRICRAYPGPCFFGVAKYTSEGQLDPSFGNDGATQIGFPGKRDSGANAVAIDSEGRVLLAGTSCDSYRTRCDFALARLDPSGNLDPSFGDGGRVITQLADEAGGLVEGKANSMAIAQDDRIVLAGPADGSKVALARYNPNGDPDPTFGSGGTVMRSVDDGFLGNITAIAIDAKDKIVAVGGVGAGSGFANNRLVMARFRRSGSLDTQFGGGGVVSTEFHVAHAKATSVAIDRRNRIVVGGGPKFYLVRYQPNGKLNRSFGHNGKVAKGLGFGKASGAGDRNQRGINAVAIDSRDRPIVAGPSRDKLAVARLIG